MEEENRFKLPKIERRCNPLTKREAKALTIVLVAIVLIVAIAFGLVRQRKEGPSVLPATTTQEEVITESEPTLTPEETPASPASPRGEPTGGPTATEPASTD